MIGEGEDIAQDATVMPQGGRMKRHKAGNGSDDFQTPVSAILDFAPFVPRGIVWDPACGKGNVVRGFDTMGFRVHGSDIKTGDDFLSPHAAQARDFDVIVTNPPYSIKDKFIARCLEIGKPWALLMPVTALGEQWRVEMWRRNGIQLVLPPERIRFETPYNKKSDPWLFTMWFCHGFNLPREINFIERGVE